MRGSSGSWLMINGQMVRPSPTAMNRYMARITRSRIGETSVITLLLRSGLLGSHGGPEQLFVPRRAPRQSEADQRDEHEPERRKGQGEQDRRAAHRLRQRVLLPEEEGAGGDEEGEA